jgi:hypothetical protein
MLPGLPRPRTRTSMRALVEALVRATSAGTSAVLTACSSRRGPVRRVSADIWERPTPIWSSAVPMAVSRRRGVQRGKVRRLDGRFLLLLPRLLASARSLRQVRCGCPRASVRRRPGRSPTPAARHDVASARRLSGWPRCPGTPRVRRRPCRPRGRANGYGADHPTVPTRVGAGPPAAATEKTVGPENGLVRDR